MQDNQEGSYSADVRCDNCEMNGIINIPKGTEIVHHECPKCATQKLKKNHKPIFFA